MIVYATDSNKLISFKSERLDFVSDGAALLDRFELWVWGDELVSCGIVFIVWHSDLLHVALDGSTVYFDALFVDRLDNAIQNLLVTWFECDYVKSNIEDDISSGVLYNTF